MSDMFSANNIYPLIMAEYEERRILQNSSINKFYEVLHEIQFIIESLGLDINKFERFSDLIGQQVSLIKNWRKSDNRFKREIENQN